jgi:hypothetical protein
MSGLLNMGPQDEALLALGLGLLNSKGSFGNALGQAGMQSLQTLNQAKEREQLAKQRQAQEQMQQMQVQQMQQKLAEQQKADAFRASLKSPQQQNVANALGGGGGPTMANAAKLSPADPNAELMFGAMQAGLMNPLDYIKAQQKDTTPIKLGAGDSLLDPKTFKPLATNPKEQTDPADWRLYQLSGAQSRGVPFDEWHRANKKAGASSVNVNTAKPLMNTVAEGLGKQIDATLQASRAATSAISTAHRLKSAVDSGKIVAGPGSDFRVLGLQLGQMLGVGGNTSAEILANTRSTIQSMAQAELDAAQQMKGQGQITEAERDIIRRAAAGDINKLTAPEVRLLAEAMEKTARGKIKAHQRNVEALKKMPGSENLLPFYQTEEPPAYEAPGTNVDDLVKRYGKP